jgi:hypothetical protein
VLSFCWVTTFDAGPLRRIQNLAQPNPSARLATLVLDGFIFIPLLGPERKGMLMKLVRSECSFLGRSERGGDVHHRAEVRRRVSVDEVVGWGEELGFAKRNDTLRQ